jgi:hypothetical protein
MSNLDDVFKLADGTTAEAGGEFEAQPDFTPIPDNTEVLATITEVKWTDFKVYGTDDTYPGINITWQIVKPDEYATRKVYQKLHLGSNDAKKSDTARKMLMAVDSNAGGKLFKKGGRPTDVDLMQALIGATMILKIGAWKMGDRQGNHVKKVAPKGTLTAAPAIDKSKKIDF